MAISNCQHQGEFPRVLCDLKCYLALETGRVFLSVLGLSANTILLVLKGKIYHMSLLLNNSRRTTAKQPFMIDHVILGDRVSHTVEYFRGYLDFSKFDSYNHVVQMLSLSARYVLQAEVPGSQ